ncbi:MAG: asparagine synthase C-terminal domain-containing protein, partial [Candidatus Cloacimonadota bacterium]|nr:asparagine synthase C-terminal domain-containing protein [Candidatus Cloacimonadota bacterium]
MRSEYRKCYRIEKSCKGKSKKTVLNRARRGGFDLLNNHSSNKTNVDKLMLADFSMYLRNSILIKSDRCSMMNGVESRAPFLDTEVIDFAFGYLNNEMKVSKNQRKIILKELCKKRLPS